MLTRLALVVAIVAWACARDSGSRDDSLTVLYPVDERSWAFFVPSQFLVFPTLGVRGADGDLRGWLARSWERSPDHPTWTVHLRPDVRWHDGVPLTAHDVKFSLELLANPAVGLETPNIFNINVSDDSTVVVRFNGQPSGWWLDYDPIYPRHLLDTLDASAYFEWEFWTWPVGAGAFRYARHLQGAMIEFEANPDYFLGRPRLDRVIIKFGEPSVTELLSGGVDAVPWIREIDLLKLRGDARFRSYHTTKPEHIRTLIWNLRDPLFADPRVRRGLTQALNLPATVPLFDVIFSRDQFFRGEMPAGLPHDTAAARQLLEAAGWFDTNGDGVRDKGRRAFRFTALSSAEQSFAQAAVFIQAALHVVNTDLQGDFGHIAFFGEQSIIGYESSRVAAALTRAAAATQPPELDHAYRSIWGALVSDLPVTFLYPLVRTTVAHRRVRGLSSPWRDDPLWYAGELWLEER